jgi:hypothetical protein
MVSSSGHLRGVDAERRAPEPEAKVSPRSAAWSQARSRTAVLPTPASPSMSTIPPDPGHGFIEQTGQGAQLCIAFQEITRRGTSRQDGNCSPA